MAKEQSRKNFVNAGNNLNVEQTVFLRTEEQLWSTPMVWIIVTIVRSSNLITIIALLSKKLVALALRIM